MKKIILLSFICSLLIFNPPVSLAEGNLLIDWGVADKTASFNVSNLTPGDSQARNFSVLNDSASSNEVVLTGIKTIDSANLASAMMIEVSKNSTSIYTNTLEHFLNESAGISLGRLNAHETAIFNLKVTFNRSAGNTFQSQKLKFDLKVDSSSLLPSYCQGLTFKQTITNDRPASIINVPPNSLVYARGAGSIIQTTSSGPNCIIISSNTIFRGGSGIDIVTSTGGGNILFGGDGDDKLIAHGSGNLLLGEAGNDYLETDNLTSILIGGLGSNICKNGLKINCN